MLNALVMSPAAGGAGGADNALRLWSTGVGAGGEEAQAAAATLPHRRAALQSYPTKATPVFAVRFSQRNLLLASGALTLHRK